LEKEVTDPSLTPVTNCKWRLWNSI